MRTDPRLRQTWNQVTQNLESANESAQAGIFTFSQHYISPCLSSIADGVRGCTVPCFGPRDDRRHRNRARSRGGRPEFLFDFYNDDNDDDDADASAFLGWGNDELDRLLAGSGAHAQPRAGERMNYGARGGDLRIPGGRRKSAVQPHEGGPDPTIIPSSSVFGFLGRLPFKVGGKGLRYKPSAADLKEHPGQRRERDGDEEEVQPLVEESDDYEEEEGEASAPVGHNGNGNGNGRKRAGTGASQSTTDSSFRSRRDLVGSEDEEDAVPLDDEFAMALRGAGSGSGAVTDEASSGNTKRSKRPPSSRTESRSTGESSNQLLQVESLEHGRSSADLRREEEEVRAEEEADIERKRDAAQQLALKKGLSANDGSEVRPPPPVRHL